MKIRKWKEKGERRGERGEEEKRREERGERREERREVRGKKREEENYLHKPQFGDQSAHHLQNKVINLYPTFPLNFSLLYFFSPSSLVCPLSYLEWRRTP